MERAREGEHSNIITFGQKIERAGDIIKYLYFSLARKTTRLACYKEGGHQRFKLPPARMI